MTDLGDPGSAATIVRLPMFTLSLHSAEKISYVKFQHFGILICTWILQENRDDSAYGLNYSRTSIMQTPWD